MDAYTYRSEISQTNFKSNTVVLRQCLLYGVLIIFQNLTAKVHPALRNRSSAAPVSISLFFDYLLIPEKY